MPRQPPWIACHVACFGPFGGAGALERLPIGEARSLEVPIRTAGFLSRFGDEPLLTDATGAAQVDDLRKRLADKGLTLANCPCPIGSLLNPMEEERAIVKLSLAARAGSPLVSVEAGDVGDTEYGTLVEVLRRIGDQGAQAGITVCIEIGRGRIRNHRYLLQLVRDVDHPQVRASFDPGLLHLYNEEAQSEVALAKICHVVRHVRLRDFRGTGNGRDFPTLGEGSGAVNFLRIHQILRDSGYRGPRTIAIETPADAADAGLDWYCARVVASLSNLRRIGSLDSY